MSSNNPVVVTYDPSFGTKADIIVVCGEQKLEIDIPDEVIYKLPVDQKRMLGEAVALVADALTKLEVRSTYVPPPVEKKEGAVEKKGEKDVKAEAKASDLKEARRSIRGYFGDDNR